MVELDGGDSLMDGMDEIFNEQYVKNEVPFHQHISPFGFSPRPLIVGRWAAGGEVCELYIQNGIAEG